MPEEPEPEPEPKAAAAPPAASTAPRLILWLQDATGKKQQVAVRSDTKFAQVFDAYCVSQGRARDSVKFLFDGDVVQPNATPAQLDIDEDDMVIDVRAR